MQLKTISKFLDLIVKFLVISISVWIVFYAFDKRLYDLLGEYWFVEIYTWVTRLIALFAVLVFVFAVFYVLKSSSENKK